LQAQSSYSIVKM